VAPLGTILNVWAHPDDASYPAAGVMAAAVENGQRVICSTATATAAVSTRPPGRYPAAGTEDSGATPSSRDVELARPSGDLLDRKVSALMAHVSQTRQLIDELGPHRFAAWVGERFVREPPDA
jgi:LmbE family N-acetylglucosaminyl deacetylase